jgi:alpha-D-ribose 1-methylphosphonate 5-triphosphate diphosphatase PhnM
MEEFMSEPSVNLLDVLDGSYVLRRLMQSNQLAAARQRVAELEEAVKLREREVAAHERMRALDKMA